MKRALAGIAVLAIVAAAAVFLHRPVAPPAPPVPPAAPVPAVAPVAEAPPVAKPTAKPASAPSLPPGNDPASLLARAKAGDVAAMYALGTLLLPCAPASADAVLRQLESHAAGTADDAATKDACATLPAEERPRGYAWIEQAAIAGHPEARRAFIAHAMDDYLMPESVIAAIDELERRRDLARRFVGEAMQNCEPDAYAVQRGAFDILGMDEAVDRLAVLHAERLGEAAPGARPEGSAAALAFARESEHADAPTLRDAERRGAAMHARCAR